jgi:hypothetical protein
MLLDLNSLRAVIYIKPRLTLELTGRAFNVSSIQVLRMKAALFALRLNELLDTLRLVNALDPASRVSREPSVMLESEPALRCFFSHIAMKVAHLSLSSFFQVRNLCAIRSSDGRSNNRLNPTPR